MGKRQWLDILRLLGLGWYVVTAIGVGVLVGILSDHWLGAAPIFVLVGLVLGILVAFWGMYKMVTPLLKTNSDNGRDDS